MKKIKVIHLAEDLKTGGYEGIIACIAEGLNREKYEPSVWCIASGGATADKLIKKGINVEILGIHSYYNPFNILKLAKLFKKYKPDIIHSHTYFSNTISRIAAKIAGVPVIITHVHNTYRHYIKRNFLIEKLLSYFTDRIICCSEAVKDFVLENMRINPRKITVIHNGIILRNFEQPLDETVLKNSLNINSNTKLLITVASLTEQKGHKYLINAMPDIIKSCPDIKLLIVGDGHLRRELLEYAEKLNVGPHIIFTGIRNDIPDLLKISDIFVMPSVFEGLGVAIIEAMAAGLPVVAASVGGIPEIVKDTVTGILIKPQDSKALSLAILSLLKDDNRIQQMGVEGQKTSRQYSAEIMIGKIEKLYANSLTECVGKK